MGQDTLPCGASRCLRSALSFLQRPSKPALVTIQKLLRSLRTPMDVRAARSAGVARFRFPRAMPAPGMAAVRQHHVFVLEQHLGGETWLAYDANSGRHLTRIHARSIAGYVIVNPRSLIAY